PQPEASRGPGPLYRASGGGLRDGQRRELYGIDPRYRAFRGDERAIRNALVEDARGLRNPVYFRFILTVDNRTAERFARLDGRLAERVLRDSVDKTFRGAARGLQGIFFLRTKKARRLAGMGSRWLDRLRRPGVRLNASTRDLERAARRLTPGR